VEGGLLRFEIPNGSKPNGPMYAGVDGSIVTLTSILVTFGAVPLTVAISPYGTYGGSSVHVVVEVQVLHCT
jgi:hypothetical protein